MIAKQYYLVFLGFLIVIGTLLMASTGNTDTANIPGYVADHLFSYYNWTGDSGSTIMDSSGNGHQGTNIGSTLNQGPVASRIFDGKATISLQQQPVAGWKGFTYETIILPTNVTPGTKHGIKGQLYGRNALYLDGAKLVIRIVNIGGYATEARSGDITTDRPTHVVMSYNNTTKYARLYVNGAYVTQVPLSIYGNGGQIWQTFLESGIANSYISGMGKFEGSMQYFRVYDIDLSDAQVQQNYRAEQWRLTPTPVPTLTPTSSPTPTPTPTPTSPGDNTGTAGRGLHFNNTFVKGSRYYLVNLQGHSNVSNPSYYLDPTGYMLYHRYYGFNAAAITDYWGITPDPGVSGITFLRGTEWESYLGNGQMFVHGDTVLVGSNLPTGSYQTARRYNSSTNYYRSWNDVRNFANLHHALVIFPHADSSNSWNYSTLSVAAQDYDLYEVRTGGVTENTTGKYDPLLQEGRKIWLVADSDTHGYPNKNVWTVVNANNAANTTLVDALRSGNMVACAGTDYSPIVMVQDIVTSGLNVTLKLYATCTVTWIGNNGRVLKTETAKDATYNATGNEKYVRAYIVHGSGDKMAWTQPMFIEPD